ncbi:MAG: O-antigen ligase family protein, partial [Planctomycetota bacterium]|nr:O-antigen ligase family protein [Planctomycetota bacterium]
MTKSDRSSKRQLPARPDRSKEPSYYDVSQQSTSWRSEAVVWGLMLARWLVPTEGTADGDTLWLTSLTLAAAAGFCWWMSRVSYEGLRLEKLDFAVGLFCGVHVLSAAVVILTEGNKRAATNMLWEWLGVAVTFFVIRQTITTLSRMQFLRTFLVVSTALACYGIWQPAFWYPSNLRDYETLRAELDAVDSSSELSSQEQIARRRELQAQFLSQGIPLSGSSRQLFERRLRDSSEPLGFFALTNTFAGFMTMSLVLLAGVLLKSLLPFASECSTDPPPGNAEITSRATIVAFGIAFLLVAYCLFLTKSRSAWGGALAGLTTLVGLCVFRSQSGRVLKHVLPVVAIGAVALSLLAGVAIFTGALDIEVISEAPRSLRYRIEYWTSTWDVILDHPLLGTGPGNFREYYLQYKLPWSSEEIADPHQFVLDVTANAGFAGLLGLAALLLSMAALAWNVCRHFASGATSFGHHRSDFPPETGTCPRRVIAVAGTVTIAGEWLFSGTFSVHVLSVCALAAGLDIVLSTVLQRSADARKLYDDRLEIPSLSVVAAIVAIFVHLSAAGGIAMPAVIVSILALAAVLKADVVSPVIEPGASELKRQK